MMDTLAALMFMENLEEDVEAGNPLRTGNTSRGGPTGLYHASDADLIITAASDDQWRRLCGALAAPELLQDPRFTDYTSRSVNVADAAGGVRRGAEAGGQDDPIRNIWPGWRSPTYPCGPVRTVPDIMADQHFYKRGTLLPMRHAAMEDPVPGRNRLGVPCNLFRRTVAGLDRRSDAGDAQRGDLREAPGDGAG